MNLPATHSLSKEVTLPPTGIEVEALVEPPVGDHCPLEGLWCQHHLPSLAVHRHQQRIQILVARLGCKDLKIVYILPSL